MTLPPEESLILVNEQHRKVGTGGLRKNTCCGHPRPGDLTVNAARRRLQEEMGFQCPLVKVGTLIYRARVSDNVIEHEFDDVYVGRYEVEPRPDPNEACACNTLKEHAASASTAPC